MNTKVAIKIIQQTPMVETKVYEPRQTENFCATMHLVKKHTFTFGHCSSLFTPDATNRGLCVRKISTEARDPTEGR